jgi:hypothetical protein
VQRLLHRLKISFFKDGDTVVLSKVPSWVTKAVSQEKLEEAKQAASQEQLVLGPL